MHVVVTKADAVIRHDHFATLEWLPNRVFPCRRVQHRPCMWLYGAAIAELSAHAALGGVQEVVTHPHPLYPFLPPPNPPSPKPPSSSPATTHLVGLEVSIKVLLSLLDNCLYN
jgi:hypothetical protein